MRPRRRASLSPRPVSVDRYHPKGDSCSVERGAGHQIGGRGRPPAGPKVWRPQASAAACAAYHRRQPRARPRSSASPWDRASSATRTQRSHSASTPTTKVGGGRPLVRRVWRRQTAPRVRARRRRLTQLVAIEAPSLNYAMRLRRERARDQIRTGARVAALGCSYSRPSGRSASRWQRYPVSQDHPLQRVSERFSVTPRYV
jgi:hypothetical protein